MESRLQEGLPAGGGHIPERSWSGQGLGRVPGEGVSAGGGGVPTDALQALGMIVVAIAAIT